MRPEDYSQGEAFQAEKRTIFSTECLPLCAEGQLAKPGEEDPDIVSAGKGRCTLVLGSSLFDQALSFTMMRGGHLTHAVMGGIQVGLRRTLTTNQPPKVKITPNRLPSPPIITTSKA